MNHLETIKHGFRSYHKPAAWPLVAIAIALASLQACDVGSPRPTMMPTLVEVTDQSGLDFVHSVAERTYFLPELMGPGIALLDYDNDNDLDIYLTNLTNTVPASEGPLPRNSLWRQDEGTFVDVSVGSGVDYAGYGQGVAVGDYDNDSFVDIYVTNYGSNRLFHNNGDGTFSDATKRSGVIDSAWSSSAAFLDFDNNGWLDLYVVNYVEYDPNLECPDPAGAPDFCPPFRFPGTPDRLYRNRGDGTFEDVSRFSGIANTAMMGLGVVCVDLNADRLVDIYVANDRQQNNLWINLGNGRFRDDAVVMGAAYNVAGGQEAGMGIVSADLDNDLDADLYVTHLRTESNTAYLNDRGSFRDATSELGLHAPTIPFTSFGVVAADLEHDGDLDLLTVNGNISRNRPAPGAELGSFWRNYAQPGVVLLNRSDGKFADVSTVVGKFGRDPQVGRGLAMGDIDNDGDLDFAVGNAGGRAQLFFNESQKTGHWLLVRARDEKLRRDAIGAEIVVEADGRRWLGWVNPASSYLSSNDLRAHFGLGDVDRIDGIEVVWPGGDVERFSATNVDQEITLIRGTGSRVKQ